MKHFKGKHVKLVFSKHSNILTWLALVVTLNYLRIAFYVATMLNKCITAISI